MNANEENLIVTDEDFASAKDAMDFNKGRARLLQALAEHRETPFALMIKEAMRDDDSTDTGPYAVFADWLEEQGKTELASAIRFGFEAAKAARRTKTRGLSVPANVLGELLPKVREVAAQFPSLELRYSGNRINGFQDMHRIFGTIATIAMMDE